MTVTHHQAGGGHPAENSGQPTGMREGSLTPDTSAAAATSSIDQRLERIETQLAYMTAGLARMIGLLDAFAERAEPLLELAEKRVNRANMFRPKGPK